METVMSNEAVAVLAQSQFIKFFLCCLAVPVLLCHRFNSCASFSSEYELILREQKSNALNPGKLLMIIGKLQIIIKINKLSTNIQVNKHN
jgi:hypothetical protein